MASTNFQELDDDYDSSGAVTVYPQVKRLLACEIIYHGAPTSRYVYGKKRLHGHFTSNYFFDGVNISEDDYWDMLCDITSVPLSRQSLTSRGGVLMHFQHERNLDNCKQRTQRGVVNPYNASKELQTLNTDILNRIQRLFRAHLCEDFPLDKLFYVGATIAFATNLDVNPEFIWGRGFRRNPSALIICTFGHPRTLVYEHHKDGRRVEVPLYSRSAVLLYGKPASYNPLTHFKLLDQYGTTTNTLFYILRFHESQRKKK